MDPGWEPIFSQLVVPSQSPSDVQTVRQYVEYLKHDDYSSAKVKERTPVNPDDILNAFSYCSPGDLKAIVLGQDPYPNPALSMGLAFSTRETNSEFIETKVRSLAIMFQELVRLGLMQQPPQKNRYGWLGWLSAQGVLLLNARFVSYGKIVTDDIKRRQRRWEEATAFLLCYTLHQLRDPIHLFLLGNVAAEVFKEAKKLHDGVFQFRIPLKSVIVHQVVHPAATARNPERKFNCPFNEISVNWDVLTPFDIEVTQHTNCISFTFKTSPFSLHPVTIDCPISSPLTDEQIERITDRFIGNPSLICCLKVQNSQKVKNPVSQHTSRYIRMRLLDAVNSTLL